MDYVFNVKKINPHKMDNWLKKISGKKQRAENNIDNKPNKF